MIKGGALDTLVGAIARLPGLGHKSAQRIALHLLAQKDTVLNPLIEALTTAAKTVGPCLICGNLDVQNPCNLCQNEGRDKEQICVVASPCDLWAMESSGTYRGLYHVTGGVLSALSGVGIEDLHISSLLARIENVQEIILALPATVDGMTTAHVIKDIVVEQTPTVRITRLAQGLPVGGELGRMDPGTIAAALRARGRV